MARVVAPRGWKLGVKGRALQTHLIVACALAPMAWLIYQLTIAKLAIVHNHVRRIPPPAPRTPGHAYTLQPCAAQAATVRAQVGELRNSLLTTHYSLLTTHYSLRTTHYALFTTHYALRTTH